MAIPASAKSSINTYFSLTVNWGGQSFPVLKENGSQWHGRRIRKEFHEASCQLFQWTRSQGQPGQPTVRAIAIRQAGEKSTALSSSVIPFLWILEHILPIRQPVLCGTLLMPRVSKLVQALSLNTLMHSEPSGNIASSQNLPNVPFLPLRLCSLFINLKINSF